MSFFYLSKLYRAMPFVACLATLATTLSIYSPKTTSRDSISEAMSYFSLQCAIITGSLYLLISGNPNSAEMLLFLLFFLSIGLIFTIYSAYVLVREDITQDYHGGFISEMIFAFLDVIFILLILWIPVSYIAYFVS